MSGHLNNINICNINETDVVVSGWLPICVNGVQWFVRESQTIDNSDGTVLNINKEYKSGANGVVTTTVPVGTIVDGSCKILVNSPNCNGTTTIESVDEINAVYLLNQHHYTQREVYDVVVASFGGQVTGSIAGTVLTLGFNLITLLNDVVNGYLIDFGTGFTDIITPTATSIQDFISQPSGKYEVKVYAITSSGNIVLLGGIELNWNGTTLTFLSTIPAIVNRSYNVLRAAYLQMYCDTTPVGNPTTISGSTYIVTGTSSLILPVIRDERFANADVSLVSTSGGTPALITPTYSTNRTLLAINTIPAAYNVVTILNCREITIQNVTSSDLLITTSQGTQTVAAQSSIILSNPSNTTINQAVFTGNINISFLSSVGANYLGVQPRVIVNQKANV